jgi:hypothetical protein
MCGREMCSLRKDDFCSRAPVFVGDILWEHLQLLQSEVDREQAALKNAPPKLSEIAQNPAAISPTPPPPRSYPVHLTASPSHHHRPYSAHHYPPSASSPPHQTPYPTASRASIVYAHSPPHVYSDCSNSSPQRPPQSPPRVYTTLESSSAGGTVPRMYSPAACGASPHHYPSQSPRPDSPLHQQATAATIKSEYPTYPSYPGGSLYAGHQYGRGAYPPHHLPHPSQFPAAYGGHQGYPAAYPLFQSGHAAANTESHAMSSYQRWSGAAESQPGAYQVKGCGKASTASIPPPIPART